MGKEIRHSQKTWLPLDDTGFKYYLQMCKMYDTLKNENLRGGDSNPPPPWLQELNITYTYTIWIHYYL